MLKSVFLEEDLWKQKRVDESLAILRRQEAQRHAERVKKCVENFINLPKNEDNTNTWSN